MKRWFQGITEFYVAQYPPRQAPVLSSVMEFSWEDDGKNALNTLGHSTGL
jgi:hypothetical protein